MFKINNLNQKIKLVLLCGVCFFVSDAYASSCTSGTDCEINSATDVTAISQNAGSHLIYNNENVAITTYGASSTILGATNKGQITFKNDVSLIANAPVGSWSWFDIKTGGVVNIDGNMTIEAVNKTSNPLLQIGNTGSQLNVAGNFTMTVKEQSEGVTSSTIRAFDITDNGLFTVKGKMDLDARNMSSGGTAFNVSGGVAKLNELNIVTDGARALRSASNGYISSTGKTTITSNNSTAIWVNNNGFMSLGETEVETEKLASQWNNIAIVNIGANAEVYGANYGIQVLSGSPETYIYVRGTVTSPNVAIQGYDNPLARDIVKVQGGTVTGDVNLDRGDDEYHMEAGLHTGDVNMGLGNNKFVVSGGFLDGSAYIAKGDNYAELSGGSVHGLIDLKGGNTTGLITGSFDQTGLVRFVGGADGTSVGNTASLNIDNYSLSAYTNLDADDSSKGLNLMDWTEINVTNGGKLTLTGYQTFYQWSNAVLSNTLNIDATSMVIGAQGTANQTIFADVNNAGTIRLDGNSTVGDIWEIRGNYTGNDGTIVFDTQLGDDNSPTDFLHITGNASGATGVEVINRGGLGALTTGDGIQLIQVDGTSTANNFALKSDYQFEGQNAVVGGAYSYSLYAGNQAGTFSGDWYLRSLTTNPTEPTDPTDPTEPVGPINPVPPYIPPSNPVYQPGAPLYEVYPDVLLQMNKLGTLQQRVGNRTWLGQHENGVDVAGTTESRGFWMKVEGSTGHINPNKSKTNTNYDINMIKTQLGVDFIAKENDKGTLIGGAYFQYGHAKADISSRFGKGDIKTNGYGLGGTLTWYGNNDVYVDGVAQYMWYKSDINSDTLNRREADGNKGTGYALSIEAGKKYALDQEWTLTPQAQLSYNSVDFDSFRDAYSAKVSRKDADALTGRLGVALDREKAWKSDAGDLRRLKAYGIANLYYEFLDGTQVQVTGVNFRNQPDRFWGGLGAGLSHNWNDDKYSIYGEVDARSSFNDFGNSYSLNGTIGFRAKF